LPSEEEGDTATDMNRKFGEIWMFLRYASGQTDRQTDTLTAVLPTYRWGAK